MSGAVKIAFGSLSAPKGSALVLFVGADMKPARRGDGAGRRSRAADPLGREGARISRALSAPRSTFSRPPASTRRGSLVVGVAPGKDNAPLDLVMLGGFVFGKLAGAQKVEVAFEAPAGTWDGAAAADFALGLRLRGYQFDKYKTRKKETDEENDGPPEFVIGSSHAAAARAGLRMSASPSPKASRSPATSSTSRRTCSFPPNSPIAPRRWRSSASRSNVLDEKAMAKLGMNALLGVGRGSARDSRLVTMRWNGARVEARQADRRDRQGRLLRFGRHLDQAVRRAWRT